MITNRFEQYNTGMVYHFFQEPKLLQLLAGTRKDGPDKWMIPSDFT